jgi:hypothetical protein
MSRKAVLERTLGKKAAKKFLPKPLTLTLPSEFIDQLVTIELSKTHASLTTDLKARKAGKGISIFEADKDQDVALIQEHLRALETVARYYGASLK